MESNNTRSKLWRPILAVIALTLFTSTVHAVPIVTPTDLSVGDQYRLVFVTSTSRANNTSNIAVLNSFVSAAAASVTELAALGTTWSAIASTSDAMPAALNTNTLFGPGVPIYRLDDVRVADDYFDLWDGTIDAPIITDETGTFNISGNVWTGTNDNGLALDPLGQDPSCCPGTAALFPNSTGQGWIKGVVSFVPAQQMPFYAMSGLLTVVGDIIDPPIDPPVEVPEPGTLGLLGVGLLALGLRRRRHP